MRSLADVLDLAQLLLTARHYEMPRLWRIQDALRPGYSFGYGNVYGYGGAASVPGMNRRSRVSVPDDAPPVVRELARKSDTNYLHLLLKTFAQVLKVDGYESASDADAMAPWTWWKRAGCPASQTGLHRAAMAYGVAYSVLRPEHDPISGATVPRVSEHSPLTCTALYDRAADEWPNSALVIEGGRISVFDNMTEWQFQMPETLAMQLSVRQIAGEVWPNTIIPALSADNCIGYTTHGFGKVPVIRYRDRVLTEDEPLMGIVEPLITVQERIDELQYLSLVAGYFTTFIQRMVIGWMPESESEEYKANAAKTWYLDMSPKDVTVQTLEAGDPAKFLEPLSAAKRDFASLGQIPAQVMGIDGISNISDATLAGLETAKNREAAEMATSLGQSHEQRFRAAALMMGNGAAAADYDSELRWRNFEARSFAQIVDGLGKLATQLGIPAEVLIEDIPGWSGEKLERVRGVIHDAQERAWAAGMLPGQVPTPTATASVKEADPVKAADPAATNPNSPLPGGMNMLGGTGMGALPPGAPRP